MNALEKKLMELRGNKLLKSLQTTVATAKPNVKPNPLLAKLAELKAKPKSEVPKWRDPEEEVYTMELPRHADVNQFILRARADFPRINVDRIKSNLLQVEGLASYRWLQSRLTNLLK